MGNDSVGDGRGIPGVSFTTLATPIAHCVIALPSLPGIVVRVLTGGVSSKPKDSDKR